MSPRYVCATDTDKYKSAVCQAARADHGHLDSASSLFVRGNIYRQITSLRLASLVDTVAMLPLKVDPLKLPKPFRALP